MDCSLPGSSVYGIFQARVLEWGAIAFSTYSLGQGDGAREENTDFQSPVSSILWNYFGPREIAVGERF